MMNYEDFKWFVLTLLICAAILGGVLTWAIAKVWAYIMPIIHAATV
jgi:regulatory protein YycH of two-component signal transduction system YycFG